MSFQQILNGPRPTTSQQAPRQADTSGIDALTTGVKLATQAIGSSYAEAQAEDGYENAFAAYNKSRAVVDGLKDNLSGLTKQYNTGDRPKGLIDQMTALEKTIRQAEMGEAAGKLSGLAVKARVDSAYKTALNRFPAFAAELRSHKDAATSGGGLGSAIQQSEINKEIAVAQSKEMASAMAKYGLDYFNPEDQHQFNNEERIMGEITRRNEYIKGVMEPSILQMEFETKRLAHASADLKFKHYQEDRPGKVQDDKISRAQAIANYNHSLIEHANSITDRPGELEQKQATLAKTRADAARTERGNRDAISSRAIATQAGKYLSQVYGMTSQEIFNGSGKGLPVERQLEILETNYAAVRGEVHQMFMANGQLGGTEYTRTMSQLDNDMASTKANIEGGDPAKIQKKLVDTMKIEKELDLLSDPNYDRKQLLKSPATASALQAYAKLMASAEAVNTPTEKSNITKQALEYAKRTGLDSIIPAQLQKDIAASIEAGIIKGNPATTEAAMALSVKEGKDMPVEDQNSEDVRTINRLAQNSKYGLEVMADWGGLAHARASSENASQYRTAHEKWFSEAARMLPDGHGIEWRNGKFHITKDDGQSVSVFDHTKKVFDPLGAQNADAHGFADWPFDISTDAAQLAGSLRDLAWIAENGKDLNLTTQAVRQPGTQQNKGFFGTSLDVANSVNQFFEAEVSNPLRQAVGIDVNTDFLTENYKTPEFNNKLIRQWNDTGKDYADIYNQAASQSGVPVDILIRMGSQESAFNPDAVGPKTKYGIAKGISQFLPDTARQYGLKVTDTVDERLDPTKSIYAQAEYMKELKSAFGTWEKAVLAYHTGRGNVSKGRIGPNGRDYVKKIMGVDI